MYIQMHLIQLQYRYFNVKIIHLVDGEGHHVESERPPNQEDIGKIFETKLGGHKIDNPLNDHMPHKDQETAGGGKFFEEFGYSFFIF